MEIILRRHSTTQNNLVRRYTGLTDEPLCKEGVALAERQPKRPDVGRVYVSGLRRTAETARILYPNAQLVPVPGLNEMSFGVFEGRSWEEMKDDADYQAWVDSGALGRCPGGETRAEFIARSGEAFRGILKEAGAEGAQEVYIVSHGGTLMALMSAFGRPKQDYFDWLSTNCGGYRLRLEWEGDTPALYLLEEIAVVGAETKNA